jgi:hypothetical protein
MRHLHLLLGVWLPLGALAGNVAHAGNIIVGVHVNNIESMTEQQQDALVALLRQHGVKTVRTGIGGAFNHFIIGAHRANIGTLAGVPPTAASKAHWHRVGNTPDAPWVGPRLTDADPEKFKAWLGAALAPLETAGVPLTAFELGNEINLSGENGDLPVPPAGQARELGLADLKNPNDPDGRAVAASYRAYLRVMAALKDVRDHSAVNRRTPIITAGLSDTGPPGKQPSWKVDSVSIPATIEFMRENGLDDLVDGYGVHFYPSNYDPDRHADHHPGRGCPRFQHRTRRHQPGIDAEIDAEQSECSDCGYCEADRDHEARVLAAVHEREAEGRDAQGCQGSRAGEARAPARQQW